MLSVVVTVRKGNQNKATDNFFKEIFLFEKKNPQQTKRSPRNISYEAISPYFTVLRQVKVKDDYYIIPPPIPPIPPIAAAAASAFSSLISAITHSVVKNIPAIEAAFSNATRETLAGSITPDS